MKIATTATTHEEDVIDYVIDSKAGTVTGTSTPELSNDTTGQEVAESGPTDLAFSATEQAAIISGTDAVVKSILAARTASTSQTQTPATATPPAKS